MCKNIDCQASRRGRLPSTCKPWLCCGWTHLALHNTTTHAHAEDHMMANWPLALAFLCLLGLSHLHQQSPSDLISSAAGSNTLRYIGEFTRADIHTASSPSLLQNTRSDLLLARPIGRAVIHAIISATHTRSCLCACLHETRNANRSASPRSSTQLETWTPINQILLTHLSGTKHDYGLHLVARSHSWLHGLQQCMQPLEQGPLCLWSSNG